MITQTRLLIGCAVLLASLYVLYYTDFFKARHIQILYRSMPGFPGTRAGTIDPVTFIFDKEYPLTDIKVVDSTNTPTTHVYWHLVSEGKAVPLTDIVYGTPIKGMKPAIGQSAAEELEPQRTYHLRIQAGKVKGDREFTTKKS